MGLPGGRGLGGADAGGAGLAGQVRGCGPGEAGGMAQVPQPAWVPPTRSAAIFSPYPDRW